MTETYLAIHHVGGCGSKVTTPLTVFSSSDVSGVARRLSRCADKDCFVVMVKVEELRHGPHQGDDHNVGRIFKEIQEWKFQKEPKS